MRRDEICEVLGSVLEGRRLLSHPFYRRWEAGALLPGDLAAYAGQYRHVEAALPQHLSTVVHQLPEGAARVLVAANLEEEVGPPEPHLELFESFATAVGAGTAPVSVGTAALVDTPQSAAGRGPAAGLAALAVYEVQAADIARSKAAGLRTHYGLGEPATRFWDVHAVTEGRHADWLVDALAWLDPAPEEVATWAAVVADAWWSFLDEREAVAQAA